MIVINTVNDERFSFNGIEYFKNFTSFVAGNKIHIFSAYDRCQELAPPVLFSDITLNGVIHGSISALQSAILPVIYTRTTLGGDGGGANLIPSRITVFGNKFFLIKHPNNNNPANVSVLELNDLITNGFRDGTEFWDKARYKTLQDKDDPVNWEFYTRQKNLTLT